MSTGVDSPLDYNGKLVVNGARVFAAGCRGAFVLTKYYTSGRSFVHSILLRPGQAGSACAGYSPAMAQEKRLLSALPDGGTKKAAMLIKRRGRTARDADASAFTCNFPSLTVNREQTSEKDPKHGKFSLVSLFRQ